MDLGKNKKFNSGCFSVVLGVVIISKKDDYGGRWQEKKKKKKVYLKRSPRVALLLQVTFTFMHSIGLILGYYYWQKVKKMYTVNMWIFLL